MSDIAPGVVPVSNLMVHAPKILGAKVRIVVGSHIYVGYFIGAHYNGMYHEVHLQGVVESIRVLTEDTLEVLG